jgi:hypothetical protein
MALVVQLDRKPRTAAESPLTPELMEFIDRAIVPLLVKQYLAESPTGQLAEKDRGVAPSLCSTATVRRSARP